MPSLALLLLTLSSPQGPVGGWNEAVWALESAPTAYPLFDAADDVTGDGVPDFFLRRGDRFDVVDAATGAPWLTVAPPAGQPPVHARSVDLDGDGLAEVLIGEPSFDGPAGADSGRLRAFAGGTAALLWTVTGAQAGDRLGEDLALADLDGDGLPDLHLLRAPGAAAELTALRGLDGMTLWTLGGLNATHREVVGEIDGGPGEDLLLGADGSVTLVAGATGTLLWTATTRSSPMPWGDAHFTDVTGDGRADLLLSLPRHQSSGGGPGAIHAFDGANGHELWQQRAWVTWTALGKRTAVADWTGDGVDDLLSYDAPELVLFRGQDGSVVWQAPKGIDGSLRDSQLHELNGDGLPDLLLWKAGSPGELRALDPVTGLPLWHFTAADPDEDFDRMHVADVNQDGTPDFVTVSPRADHLAEAGGAVRAVSGASGQTLWVTGGALPGSHFGLRSALAELDGLAGPDWLVQAAPETGTNPETGVTGLHGATGNGLWFRSLAPLARDREVWTVDDFDQDGVTDLLASATDIETDRSDHRLLDGNDGATRWGASTPNQFAVAAPLAVLPDIDGDAHRDLIWQRQRADGWHVVEGISGADAGYRPGVEASANSLSIQAGGTIDLALDFPPHQADALYRVLASLGGTGPLVYQGLAIPLTDDRLLRRTAAGDDLGVVQGGSGRLDGQAAGAAQLVVGPGQLPAGLAGSIVHFAAVSAPAAGAPPAFSSAATPVQLIP